MMTTTNLTVERQAVENGDADHPLGNKRFSAEELKNIRGEDGIIPGMIPARSYYDEDMYKYETDHILKKNWLIVGRWDEAEKPGDYFTRRMFGESIIIIRNKEGKLRAFINVCRHRWSQLVEDGKGNAKLLVCAYHSWTYDLDGNLRGVAMKALPGLDKKDCNLHEIRLEEWQGFIFLNFNPDAEPLAPTLTGLTAMIDKFGLSEFRMLAAHTYETEWNYKFAFETGYETYHHEGVHKDLLAGSSLHFDAFKFGENWGTVRSNLPIEFPHGMPPWLEGDPADCDNELGAIIAGIYPHNIMVITPHRLMWIHTEHWEMTHNRATLGVAVAPWAPNQEADFSIKVHDQDKDGCRLLQKGITSQYNKKSYVHPLESQMAHYYQWFANQFETGHLK
jgi:phenylpropionate dioxygenase-like ring-hydroxylating dioxygenase large terminal subunit